MPNYRVITVYVNTPIAGCRPNQSVEDFEKMVTAEINRGAKLIGGVNVSVLQPDSGFPTLVYSQAVVSDG